MDLLDGTRVNGLAGQHVVVQRAEVVEVRALIHGLAVDLLGRHELGHAGDLVGGRYRQREVDQPDRSRIRRGEQYVLRREVAVHHAHLRGLDQRLTDHLDQVGCEVRGDRSTG